MARPGARPGAWKTKPMPGVSAPLAVERVYSAAEVERLREGLVPEEMEDRWFIVWRDDGLDLHRSWTGYQIFRVELEPALFGHRIARAWVSRDPEQHGSIDDTGDARLLRWLLDALVLGYACPFPAPPRAPAVTLVAGDLCAQACDAIVNAANEALAGGGGVDGAIHRAAGPALVEACRRIPPVHRAVRCPTGEARVTPASGRLQARWLVHAVGPVYQGRREDDDLLTRAFTSALDAAVLHGARTVAVPAISCGVYSFPVDRAAALAVAVARAPRDLDEVRFVMFDAAAHAAWARALAAPP